MTGGRCHRQKKMMGRGAERGCGTEEKPCPISRAPAKISAKQPGNPEKEVSLGVDLYAQARKALSDRCPFETEEALANTVSTLPSGLACLLSKHSDSRKRHKKSHSDTKSSSRQSRGANIWLETEGYFRELAFPDIETLVEVSSSVSLATEKNFLIPYIGNSIEVNGVSSELQNGENANGNGIVAKEEDKKEDNQLMEIDSVETEVLPPEEKACSQSPLSSGLEWLLGLKNKVLLTSERPNKKRKLLGSDAGLEKLIIARPCEGNSSLCHFCCTGDIGEQSNRLIVCRCCNVAVHQKCYGMQEDIDEESWLCTWCRHKNDKNDASNGESVKPCVLCPKQGGALKPLHKSEDEESMEFSHLFCSQWMPEVYVEDTRKMEPIMNIDGIKETRKKLVCNVCKVKYGACVRCSNGACRTSFHPICAREARHRMEIWGKLGCDNLELRAFCLKHSEVQDVSSTQQLGDFSAAVGSNTSSHPPVTSVNKPQKLKIGLRNGDKIAVHMETPDNNSNKLSDGEFQETGLPNTRSKAELMSGCADAQQLIGMRMLETINSEGVNPSDSINLALILKKLIERGKASVKDVALDIGVSPDSLAATLADDHLVPDLQCKILKWLKDHAYMGTLQKNMKVKIKSAISSKDEIGEVDGSNAVLVSETDIPEPVPVKSVPPRRRTKSNIRILKDNRIICSSEETFSDNGTVMDEVNTDQLAGELENSSKRSFPSATEKPFTKTVGFQDSLERHSPKFESSEPSNCSLSDSGRIEEDGAEDNTLVNLNKENPVCSVVDPVPPDLINTKTVSGSYIHPLICQKLRQTQSGLLLKNTICSRGPEISPMETSSYVRVPCNHQSQHSTCTETICKSDGENLEQLVKARNTGVLELSPEDEVVGELIYFQNRLLGNAVARKNLSDDLICKVVKSLPQEIEVVRKQKWDSVLVNQYLCELKEAKKQGRKERRHKEAQAVLAAATAAAAASSRISSFRKDAIDESAHQENLLKVNTSSGRAGLSSQPMPRAKETLSRVAAPRVSSEKFSDFVQSNLDFSKEHGRSCDICRRSETILNPILVCSSCKVAVHLDCYRSVTDSPGPWYCELCEELVSSKGSRAPAVNFWEKPAFAVECGLCGGNAGAFRKTTDDQWVHAFCAEWVLESTFRKGQVNPVEGMETVSKGSDVCYICHRKNGVCIKCNYGHCQSTFHASCARSAGLYMNVKTGAGKLQHKAYCEKHSLEQRAKAETQKAGIEELKNIKQIRVELERLRLLCERIIKREKLKRELILCSHDILASKRDSVALSVLVHSPFFPPDVSSESATTSLKGHMDGYKSSSEAVQRSDDITVDSTISGKHCIKLPVSMDSDQKTDDSSTSQHLCTRKPSERTSFCGKQIPLRPSSVASRNVSGEVEKRSKSRKHTETFEKELVMTSDQASVKNQRLPKGFVYVPIGCLSKEKQINQDACPRESVERDG